MHGGVARGPPVLTHEEGGDARGKVRSLCTRKRECTGVGNARGRFRSLCTGRGTWRGGAAHEEPPLGDVITRRPGLGAQAGGRCTRGRSWCTGGDALGKGGPGARGCDARGPGAHNAVARGRPGPVARGHRDPNAQVGEGGVCVPTPTVACCTRSWCTRPPCPPCTSSSSFPLHKQLLHEAPPAQSWCTMSCLHEAA